jgi:hypothetical protein
VIRRHVLSALAAGVAAGDEDAARARLRRIDWVLRGPARRRLERAVIDAALAVPAAAGDPETIRHILRLAALRLAGRRADPDDPDQVASAYRALRNPPPPRAWLATITAAIAGLALVAVAGATLARRSARRSFARALPPPTAGAFRDGGQPLADPAIAALLAGPLTELVIAVDLQRRDGALDADRERRRARVVAPTAITAHGPALAAAWRQLIELFDRAIDTPDYDPARVALSSKLAGAVRAVTDGFAAAGLGYYLEGEALLEAGKSHAAIYAYRVEDVRFVAAGGKPRRVLALRRLDHLNLTHTMLGMESPQLGDPVLLLDRIDAHVASKTLPVLARDLPYPLGDPSWAALAEAAPVARAAGDAVRAELARCLGDDAGDAARIATLLAERAAIVERWRSDLAYKNIAIPATDQLFLPAPLLPSLDGLVGAASRGRVRAIEAELADLQAARIAARLEDLVAGSVRRHEAQHGVDDDRGPAWRDAEVDTHGLPTAGLPWLPAWARLELSAYASQIASDPVTPQVAYWHVANFAFDRHAWGSAEAYAAVVISAGIARHLRLPGDAPFVHDREIDRARLAALAAGIAAAPDDALREAARATWQDLFGEPLAPIVDAR